MGLLHSTWDNTAARTAVLLRCAAACLEGQPQPLLPGRVQEGQGTASACRTLGAAVAARGSSAGVDAGLEEGPMFRLLDTALQAAHARIKAWPRGRRGWSVLGPGVSRVYRQGRAAFVVVQDEASPEHLHAWRKQMKYLWHQLQVLQPIQLGLLTALADQAHTLAEQLGEDHGCIHS